MGDVIKFISMLSKKLQQKGDDVTCPVAVIVRDNKVLMGLRHYTPDKWKTISVWTIPGGRCDDGEEVEETLRREVEEETGINDLYVSKFVGEFPGAKEGDKVPVFLCESDQEARLLEPKKFSEWKWFGKDDLPQNFINKHVRRVLFDIIV
ncbi:MAG: NUDIX hydrolase [Candidatus Pacebacteria bacterium]|nr:NUDIX hydrolase [Candidatus Paceibacterota bacterium]